MTPCTGGHVAVADIDRAALTADPDTEIRRAVRALRACVRCGLARHSWPTPSATAAGTPASDLESAPATSGVGALPGRTPR